MSGNSRFQWFKSSGYRAGLVDNVDRWAVRLAPYFRNSRKWLSSPDRLKIARYVNLDQGHRFLEIGPQTGWRTLCSLMDSGQKVTALDYYAFCPVWELYDGGIDFILADAGRCLPFRNESFDHCVFMGTMSYLPSPLDVLREVRRVLKPGGYLFLSCNNRDGHAFKMGLLDPIMKTIWNRGDMQHAMQETGFDIAEMYGWGFPPTNRFQKLVYNLQKFDLLGGMYRKMVLRHQGGESFVCCIAQKN